MSVTPVFDNSEDSPPRRMLGGDGPGCARATDAHMSPKQGPVHARGSSIRPQCARGRTSGRRLIAARSRHRRAPTKSCRYRRDRRNRPSTFALRTVMSGFAHESTHNISVEWYTPPEIFTALGLAFDLDPCSPGPGKSFVPARRHYTVADDGLDGAYRNSPVMLVESPHPGRVSL